MSRRKKMNPVFKAILQDAKKREAENLRKSKIADDSFTVTKACKGKHGIDYTIEE